jgi:hypothetical protein
MTLRDSLAVKLLLLAIFVAGVLCWVHGYRTDTRWPGYLAWMCMALFQIGALLRDLGSPPVPVTVTATTDDFVRKLRQPAAARHLRLAGIVFWTLFFLFNLYLFVSE